MRRPWVLSGLAIVLGVGTSMGTWGQGPDAPKGDEAPEDPSVHLKPLEPLVGKWTFGAPDGPRPFSAEFQWRGTSRAWRTRRSPGRSKARRPSWGRA
jgi:hypothetical protein